MRFSEKLQKLRKENNLSQEQLADKLGVSRQAVSKWESGNSYPDMEKMLQMCKVLNCHLEDIMDDGSIGNKTSNIDLKNKIDINTCMKDFLDFITRVYNMFCSMKFKEKIKCVFEMTIIAIILLIAFKIIMSVFEYIIFGLIPITAVWNIISIILTTVLIIFSIIIFIHLFKIRYLDYFVTIEDQNATEKTIEEPIEKRENKYYQEKQREKIIIRDPKHSTLKFFDVLGEVIVLMLKLFTVFIAIPIILLFVLSISLTIASLFHMQYGILFLFIAMAFAGGTLILYDVIEELYNFVIGKATNFKKIFIIGIIGLVMCGTGAGLAVCTFINFENVEEFSDENYITENIEVKMKDNLYFTKDYYYEYEIDNSIDNIQVEITHIKGATAGMNLYETTYNGTEYSYYYFYQNIQPISMYKNVMKDLKDKKIRNYDEHNLKIKIKTSQENYEKLEENFNIFY